MRRGAAIDADGTHPAGMIPPVNYELYMGEALAEARTAVARGERPHAAVAVLDEAMVARAHDRVHETDDPTAHAVVLALREAARRVGRARLREATIFATMEPCPMCIGALLASDVEALVFAVPNREARRRRHAPPARRPPGPAAPRQGRQRHPPRRGRGALRGLHALTPVPRPKSSDSQATSIRHSSAGRSSSYTLGPARPFRQLLAGRHIRQAIADECSAVEHLTKPPRYPPHRGIDRASLVSSRAERCPSG